MKVFKLEVLIIDEGVSDEDEAVSIIDETRYPNHVNVSAVTCREAEIGEWYDNNPLNYEVSQKAEMNRLFPHKEN